MSMRRRVPLVHVARAALSLATDAILMGVIAVPVGIWWAAPALRFIALAMSAAVAPEKPKRKRKRRRPRG